MSMFMRPLTVESAIEDGIVPHVSARGEQFVQLYQRLPLGKYLYLPFERNYDTSAGVEFTREHWVLPIVVVSCSSKTPRHFQLQSVQVLHPHGVLELLVFGFNCSSSPRFLSSSTPTSLLLVKDPSPLSASICSSPTSSWGVGATGLWVQLFIFSKIPELIDTYFIVARQRPLIFLHWYHHVTVLLYCWHSYSTEASQALYFVAMNYSVHAIMYGYYCLMALKMKPKWLPPVVITIAQISQMFVGVAVQLAASYKYFTEGASCGVNGANIFWGGMMYSSYFFLFSKFAVERYLMKPEKKVV
eukprot:CAMPEP_0114370378 /NCGR_PEP_ID=MMETSP0101-20121206/32465_1 /TAXON_ID=38822 ORGANISM="Pteridomonas danica, Strain PT" /NCGR_SAMPLE_ID=MMETSP0101 /ASSEMBLY_ACC=CAM_ASM_000211 /LENGTH=300 /DNA_ID=CAMNT_0001521877 /DNA_START=55 /DNA_END=957 /DNA_ORIENTATION=+